MPRDAFDLCRYGMSESTEKQGSLSPLGDTLDELTDRFGAQTALGLLVLDASPLEEIESRSGHEAHACALASLAAAVDKICSELCDGAQMVSVGELGRSELFVSIVRPTNDIDFYRDELPRLSHQLGERLARQGQRIVYPYLRKLPSLWIGRAYVMRNPRIGAVTQIRAAIDSGRQDAALNRSIDMRERSLEFMDVLVSGRVRSVYEPIVDAKGLTVFGYEALARGEEGSSFSGAAELFGMAAQENLLFELDCLCRHKALEGAIDFPDGVKLFMNIRPTSIHDPSFQPDALTRTLDECGLSPSDVVFEISEQESIENYEIFREARDAYGRLGFQFALDDTGAGYASLEAVLELSPEFIKVDRAFVKGINEDPARQNMVRAFQRIADDTNAKIIGEGLDTLEELQTLGELGIQFGQGWLFGKPAPLRRSS